MDHIHLVSESNSTSTIPNMVCQSALQDSFLASQFSYEASSRATVGQYGEKERSVPSTQPIQSL